VVLSATWPTTPAGSRAAEHGTPCTVTVQPGDRLQHKIDQAGKSAVVCFRPGMYHLRKPLVPVTTQQLVGDDSVLSGAMRLHFTRHGKVWTAPEHHADGQRSGYCEPRSHGACRLPNDVLRDGRPLHRVFSRNSLEQGTYLIRYGKNRVVVPKDPAGHRIQIEVSPAAFVSDGTFSTSSTAVVGFTVENFASPAQHGAIDASVGGWEIVRDVVRVNHGAGISTVGHSSVRRCRVVRNGQEGIAGDGDYMVINNNVIAHNNVAHFDPGWEAGGGKWAVADHLLVKFNRVFDNDGPGLWDDIDSTNVEYEFNTVRHNTEAGIFHEIGGVASIHDNTVRHNGFGKPEWLWGSGILIAASHDVTVTRNTVSHNAEGIGLVQQDRGVSSRDGTPRVLHDIAISDNRVHMAGGNSGVVEDTGDTALFKDDTIVWSGDTWYGAKGKPFEWNDTEISAQRWQATGHDVDGTFRP
jgi:hypothetical protein